MNTQTLVKILCAACIAGSVPCGAQKAGLPAGEYKIWEDRGKLSPAKVFWGAAYLAANPASRLPSPPFSKFERDDTPNAYSPKCKVTDNHGVKWTIKFGPEVHADIAAPRLAWALGFRTVESYYVPAGTIQGVNSQTDLGKAQGWVKADGSFQNARFKRHNREEDFPNDAAGRPLTWDEAVNPGVPPEQLSGLLLFDVMVHNWDAQPKNCRVCRVKGPGGTENWLVMSDMGASFGRMRSKWNLKDYQEEAEFIRNVSDRFVELHFSDAIPRQAKIHRKIPLAHAQWFRNLLEKLTDEEIRAAFDAAFATEAMNRAYLSRNNPPIDYASSSEVNAFVAKFREKIEEFKRKVPAGS